MFKVACIQMCSGTDVQKNCADAETLIRQAASKGAIYIQTPEMTGLVNQNGKELFQNVQRQGDDVLFNRASELAKELNIWLHIGSTPILLGSGEIANRTGLFSSNGELVASYDKIHMFDVDLDNGESWRESKAYKAGTECILVDTDFARLGLSICYDLRFPHLYRQQALQGAQIITCPAAFTRQTGKAHWHTLLKARAIENGAFMIAAAQGGDHQDGRQTYGHALIVDPWGEIIAELDHDETGFIMAEIDLEVSAKARKKIPNLANGKEFIVKVISNK